MEAQVFHYPSMRTMQVMDQRSAVVAQAVDAVVSAVVAGHAAAAVAVVDVFRIISRVSELRRWRH
jgi:hypothetical protein